MWGCRAQSSVEVNGGCQAGSGCLSAPHDSLSTEPACLLQPMAELWLEAESGAEAGTQEARHLPNLGPTNCQPRSGGGNPEAGAGVEEGTLPGLRPGFVLSSGASWPARRRGAESGATSDAIMNPGEKDRQ